MNIRSPKLTSASCWNKIVICPTCDTPYRYRPFGSELGKQLRQFCKECHKQFGVSRQLKALLLDNNSEPSENSENSDLTKKQTKVSTQGHGKGDTHNPPGGKGKTLSSTFNKIDDDAIEFALLECLNQGNITPQLINTMITFYDKIRGKDDKIRDNIDMEAFKELGLSIQDSD